MKHEMIEVCRIAWPSLPVMAILHALMGTYLLLVRGDAQLYNDTAFCCVVIVCTGSK